MKKRNKIILVQPAMGISGEFVCHIPLSLLYVASGLVKSNYNVIILDNRINHSWKKKLLGYLDEDVLFVGITVMSGAPIANAIEVSRFVKKLYNTPVVWGGAHPTLRPEQILKKNIADFTVSGSGVDAARKLADILNNSYENTDKIKNVPGLGYKRDGNICFNLTYNGFEHVLYRDIPYHLIENISYYGQIGSLERIFPIYSSYGCPYNCSFCVSPYLYRNFKHKWIPLSISEIGDHIEYLKSDYGATEIYFYDDDSFVDLNHVQLILKEIKKRKIEIKLSFRGARVNEILKMDNEYLNDLTESSTHILHIGIESGSQRMLDLFKKGIKVEDIIKMNKKLAEVSIIAAYNWIIGTPTETMDDLRMTRELILKLISDNPRCFIFQPNKFHPLPGTELADLAARYGYKEPSDLEDWIYEEVEGDKSEPWYSSQTERTIKMLQVTSYFIDNKSDLIISYDSVKNSIIKFISRIYRPFARYRFKNNTTVCLLEYPIYKFFVSRYSR